ncbi:MAG: tyrosine-type recombinase/integrase [Thermomicrobiales bacterium]
MAKRVQNRLTARFVETVKAPGSYGDGEGLYLNVGSTGSKSWFLRYRLGSSRKDMGLGSLNAISLARARELATEARSTLAKARAGEGLDPLAAREAKRKADQEAKIREAARRVTFGELCDEHLAEMSSSWTRQYYEEWKRALEVFAAELRPLPVAEVDTERVLAVLKPLWLVKPVTAKLLRVRIAAVLDRGKVKGLRSGENPAAWVGHLKLLLPKRPKSSRRHYPALPYQRLPEFIANLRTRKSVQALAAEFVILTAARVSEATLADWSEIDREARLWVVPASRMKLRIEHRVALSARALAVLDELEKVRQGSFVFPGRDGKHIHKMTVLSVIKELAADCTTHGMRSAFRDWAAEETNFPREAAEQCLAHRLGDQTELSYKRGDMIEKRRRIMEAWSQYIEPRKAAKVIPLAKAKR